MGYAFAPVYGEDVGSAIEKAEQILAKIKTNKFDKQDLSDFARANTEIIFALIQENDD